MSVGLLIYNKDFKMEDKSSIYQHLKKHLKVMLYSLIYMDWIIKTQTCVYIIQLSKQLSAVKNCHLTK